MNTTTERELTRLEKSLTIYPDYSPVSANEIPDELYMNNLSTVPTVVESFLICSGIMHGACRPMRHQTAFTMLREFPNRTSLTTLVFNLSKTVFGSSEIESVKIGIIGDPLQPYSPEAYDIDGFRCNKPVKAYITIQGDYQVILKKILNNEYATDGEWLLVRCIQRDCFNDHPVAPNVGSEHEHFVLNANRERIGPVWWHAVEFTKWLHEQKEKPDIPEWIMNHIKASFRWEMMNAALNTIIDPIIIMSDPTTHGFIRHGVIRDKTIQELREDKENDRIGSWRRTQAIVRNFAELEAQAKLMENNNNV